MSVSIELISLNPCEYCNRGYQCHDIAITSCKHAFHPFCLAQVVKSSNRCFICGLILHLDWWRTWGFSNSDEEMQTFCEKFNLLALQESMKQSLKE
jgi:hypothetical protein